MQAEGGKDVGTTPVGLDSRQVQEPSWSFPPFQHPHTTLVGVPEDRQELTIEETQIQLKKWVEMSTRRHNL